MSLILWSALSAPAQACPFEEARAAAEAAEAAETAAAPTPAAIRSEAVVHSAQRQDLIGTNCSFTTSVMARRVVEEGAPFSFLGELEAADNDLGSRVAAPYQLSSDTATFVVANELIESLDEAGEIDETLFLEGRLLEVDGVRYMVVASYQVQNS